MILLILGVAIQDQLITRVFFVNFKIHKDDFIFLFIFVSYLVLARYNIITLLKYVTMLIFLNIGIIFCIILIYMIYSLVTGCVLTSEIYNTLLKMVGVLHRLVLPSLLYMALTIYVLNSISKLLKKKISIFLLIFIIMLISMTIYIVAFQVLYYQIPLVMVIYMFKTWALITCWAVILTFMTCKVIHYLSIKRLERWALKFAYIIIASLIVYIIMYVRLL